MKNLTARVRLLAGIIGLLLTIQIVATQPTLATEAPSLAGSLPSCFLASDDYARLTGFDLNTNTEIDIGDTMIDEVEAIEYDPFAGIILAARKDELWSIDPITAESAELGKWSPLDDANGSLGILEIRDVDGIAYDPLTNIWYAAGRLDDNIDCGLPDYLFQFDPATGNYIPEVFADVNGDTVPDDYVVIEPPSGEPCMNLVDDLSLNPFTGQLFGNANGTGIFNDASRIVEINKSDGTTTDLGEIAYDDGNGPVSIGDIEGMTLTLDGRTLAVTGDSRNLPEMIFNLTNLGSGTIDGLLLSELGFPNSGGSECNSGNRLYCDYEAVTCLVYDANVPLAIGNFVWFDGGAGANTNNGKLDADESGIDGVTVQLYQDDGDLLCDPATDIFIAEQETSNGGFYLFLDLALGSYCTHVPAAEFQAGGTLNDGEAYRSSLDNGGDDANDHDNDENGVDAVNPEVTGVSSTMVLLSYGFEPQGELQAPPAGYLDENVNLTVDFGFYSPRQTAVTLANSATETDQTVLLAIALVTLLLTSLTWLKSSGRKEKF